MGGWDRVVVLGWNFEPSIEETITALNDSQLEVLVIPPDLMDRLKRKGGLDKLRVVTQAVVTAPLKAGSRKVCVRVVDVFGFEAEVVSTVAAP